MLLPCPCSSPALPCQWWMRGSGPWVLPRLPCLPPADQPPACCVCCACCACCAALQKLDEVMESVGAADVHLQLQFQPAELRQLLAATTSGLDKKLAQVSRGMGGGSGGSESGGGDGMGVAEVRWGSWEALSHRQRGGGLPGWFGACWDCGQGLSCLHRSHSCMFPPSPCHHTPGCAGVPAHPEAPGRHQPIPRRPGVAQVSVAGSCIWPCCAGNALPAPPPPPG